jgi:hypothetical protein
MASKSLKYMTRDKRSKNSSKKSYRFTKEALRYGTSVDLDPLLMASDSDMERIPLFHFYEGKA